MNPEIKSRWVAALRSGQYKQIRGGLSDGEGFCCLGVLCNLHALETDTRWESPGERKWADYLMGNEVLPKRVMKWAGLDDEDPYVETKILGYSLTCWNDHMHYSFDQIANLIEEKL